MGNFTVYHDGSAEWSDLGDDTKDCPFCSERLQYDVIIKNEVNE